MCGWTVGIDVLTVSRYEYVWGTVGIDVLTVMRYIMCVETLGIDVLADILCVWRIDILYIIVLFGCELANNFNLLIQKLRTYKWSDITIDWFTSYIKGRSQCTIYKGKLSDTLFIKTGVLQGSMLGPLLFILFINDLPMALQDTNTDMYADDSTLTAQAKTIPKLEEKLSSDVAKVSNWYQENHMAANTTKPKAMLATTWQK